MWRLWEGVDVKIGVGSKKLSGGRIVLSIVSFVEVRN